MPATLVCPVCSLSMVVPVAQPGGQVRCPGCRHVFRSPAPQPPTPARPAPPPVEVLSLDDAEQVPVSQPPRRPVPVEDDLPPQSNTQLVVGSLVALILAVGGVVFWFATRDAKRDDGDATSSETTAAAKKETGATVGGSGALPADESKDLAAIDTLIHVLRTGDPADRVVAARRLGALGTGGTSAIPALVAAADPKTPALEAASGAALAKIGPPKAGGETVLVKAVTSTSAVVRAYAVASLADAATVPTDAVAALVKVLADASPKVRMNAAKALGKSGAKADALAPLLDLAADPDDAVRVVAAAALTNLGPPAAEDKPTIQAKLTHSEPKVRLAAAGFLAPLATTADDASATWPKLLKDADPEVRAFALAQMVKFPEALEKSGEAVVMLLADPTPTGRNAALAVAPKHKGFAGLESGIARLLDNEPDAEVKKAAFVAAVTLADPVSAQVPLFRKALQSDSAPAKQIAADKLAALKSDAAPAVDELISCVGNVDAEVCAAAIRALAAVGPDGAKAGPAVAKSFASDKAPEPVLVAAAEYLVGTPAGLKTLKDARARTLPAPVVAAMCRAFAKAGDTDMLKWMTDQARDVEDCRATVAEVLVKHADDAAVRNLIEMTYGTRLEKGKQEKVSVESRRWALATLTKMDLMSVATAATRTKLHDRVKDLSMAIRPEEKELAAEAKAFLKSLKP